VAGSGEWGGGRAAEWQLLLDGRRSSAGSGEELEENNLSVYGWLLKVGVARRL
jgi:hypothetical protein